MRQWTKGMLAGLLAGALSLSVLPALAGTNSPLVDQREQNQQNRISQGVQSGQVTPREFNRLENQQARIQRAEARMKADSNLTPGERGRLNARLNQSSRNIYRKKHNNRNMN